MPGQDHRHPGRRTGMRRPPIRRIRITFELLGLRIVESDDRVTFIAQIPERSDEEASCPFPLIFTEVINDQ